MKRLLLVLVMASSAFGDQRSVGPDGINSKITGLNGSSPLDEAIVIGEAETYRAGKPDYDDDPVFYASDTIPYGVWFGNVGSAPGVDLFVRAHATEVAGVMIGRSGDIPGVAPAARLHSLAYSDDQNDSNIGVNLQSLARTTGMKAINISWNAENSFLQTNGRSLLSQFVDWSAKRHDVLYVLAGGNIPDFDRAPADSYNGITVAASAPDMDDVYSAFSYVNRDPSLRDQNFYDRSYIDIMAPGESVRVQGLTDQTFFRDGTSYAAPHVTGTIALLWQYRDQQSASEVPGFQEIRHYSIKAVIMNSADKLAGVHGSTRTVTNHLNQNWLQSPAYTNPFMPLDPGMGTGHLNAGRAIDQFSSGNETPTLPEVGNTLPMIGWSQFFVEPLQSQEYVLETPISSGYISITLCWDRIVEHTGGNTYHYGDTFFPYADDYGPMNDLDLYLETTDGTVVASSVSTAFNVEHIFFDIEMPGNYKIVVYNTGGGLGSFSEFYGLAWWYGDGPSHGIAGDYNGDGNVDAADYVVWRKDPASFGGPGGYDTWRANFGATSGSGSGSSFAAVPEPSGLLLLVMCIAILGNSRVVRSGKTAGR